MEGAGVRGLGHTQNVLTKGLSLNCRGVGKTEEWPAGENVSPVS